MSTGQDIILRFDLEKDPSAQILRVWKPENLAGKGTSTKPEPSVKGKQISKTSPKLDKLKDMLRRATEGKLKLFLNSPPEATARQLNKL